MKHLIRYGLYTAFFFRELRQRFTAPKIHSLPTYNKPPNYLTLALTNICNANCIFCSYQYRTSAGTVMPMEIYKRSIDQFVSLGGGSLSLTPPNGEALLDKELEEKIAYAKTYPQVHDIYIFTNGILLTRSRFEKIVDAGVTHLVISISGFDKAEYERIFRNKFYKKVLKNLYDISASDRFPMCKVEISLRTDSLFPSMKQEYRHIIKLGYEIVNMYFYDNWGGRIKQKDLPGFMFVRPKRKRHVPCHILYAGPIVYPNGNISACGCRDVSEGNSELYLGNIKTTLLRDSWLDGRVEEFRQGFFKGDPPDICKDCRHYGPVSLDKLQGGL